MHNNSIYIFIDLEKVVEFLKKVNYSGDLTFKADCYLKNANIDIETGVKNLKNSVEKIRKMFFKIIEFYQKNY